MVGDSPKTAEQRHRAEVAEARPGWHWWLVMVVTAVAGPGAAIWVSAHNQHRSEQEWCELLDLTAESTRAAQAARPSDVRARRAVDAVARLRKTYDCP